MAGQENRPGFERKIRTFSCRGCGGQVEVRTFGHSVSCFCKHCGSEIDATNSDFKLVKKFYQKTAEIKLDIPLGTRGKLKGTTWEVVGYLQRKASGFGFYWKEYLLFNPWHGYRWLTQTYGHWSFVEPLRDLPEGGSQKDSFYSDKKFYQLFNKGKATVTQIAGEFYWHVHRGDLAKTTDFILPPVMLSKEETETEIVWSKGTYLEPSEVKAAFNIQGNLPVKVGVGANQPNPFAGFAKSTLKIFGICLAIMFVISIIWTNLSPKSSFFSKNEFLSNGKELLIPGIDITGPESNVMVQIDAVLDNRWLEAEGYLFNEAEAKSYGFNLGMEHYYGVSGGESWSEGSNSSWVIINNVPPGKYELMLSIAADDPKASPGDPLVYPAHIQLYRNQVAWSNFLIILILLGIPVGIAFGMNYLYEKRRWEDESE